MKEDFLMRSVWAVPLCSDVKEPHWVVAYIDIRQKEIGVYESEPANCSSFWAIPVSGSTRGKSLVPTS